MGGSTHETQQTQQVQQNQIDPEQKALLMGNYATAQGNAAKLNAPYTGMLTAGFNPTQTQAQGLFSSLSADPSFQAANKTAMNTVGGILGAPLSAASVNASTIGGADLSKYMNPYTNDVINNSISQNERARQIAGVQNNQLSTQAHAFGGARAGVADSLTNEAYDRNNLTAIAGLNQANFAQAQQAAGTDASTRNQVGEFNSTQGLNAGQFNANTGLTGAGVLSSLGNNGLNLATQQAGLLGSVGDVQQQQQQSEIGNQYQNWLQGQNMTLQQQNLLNSALGLMPTQQTVTTNGNVSADKSTTPGATDILTGLGSAGMGLGSMGLGFADVRAKVLRFDPGKRRLASFRYVPEVSAVREAA